MVSKFGFGLYPNNFKNRFWATRKLPRFDDLKWVNINLSFGFFSLDLKDFAGNFVIFDLENIYVDISFGQKQQTFLAILHDLQEEKPEAQVIRNMDPLEIANPRGFGAVENPNFETISV